MATEILAVGSSVASSSEVTLADGASTNLSMKNNTGDAVCAVELMGDDSAFVRQARLDASCPGRNVLGPGIFRVTRLAGTCGVFSA